MTLCNMRTNSGRSRSGSSKPPRIACNDWVVPLAPWDGTCAERGAIIRPTPGSKGKIAFLTVLPMFCSIRGIFDKALP